ncbi:MAG TPA: hypothetical protein VF607_10890 [Verrucomicrobiae bacterium]
MDNQFTPTEGDYRSPTERALIFGALAAYGGFLVALGASIFGKADENRMPHSGFSQLISNLVVCLVPPVVAPVEHPAVMLILAFLGAVFTLHQCQLGRHRPSIQKWLLLCLAGVFVEGVMLLLQLAVVIMIIILGGKFFQTRN